MRLEVTSCFRAKSLLIITFLLWLSLYKDSFTLNVLYGIIIMLTDVLLLRANSGPPLAYNHLELHSKANFALRGLGPQTTVEDSEFIAEIEL